MVAIGGVNRMHYDEPGIEKHNPKRRENGIRRISFIMAHKIMKGVKGY